MRIALVALTRGNLSGGFQKYLQRITPLLRDSVERLDLLLPAGVSGPADFSWPHDDEWRGFRQLRRTLRSLRPDVVFIPTARFLAVDGAATVVMVRNMEPLEVPFGGNTLVEGLKNLARARAARVACRRAGRVIAVSRHVHDFLVQRWSVSESKIGTVYHGIDTGLAEGAPPSWFSGRRFLFTAGSIRPARGLEDAITAMKSVPHDTDLVVAGSVDHGAEHYKRELRRLAAQYGLSERLIWAGQLDASAMTWCFRRAEAFLMTSRAEACPNIVLEALANGSLSISTDHPPMPEFFGDAASYYKERDAAALATRIVETLSLDAHSRHQIRQRAAERAMQFRWETTAAATLHELHLAVATRTTR